jgi:hypothetical protein
MRIAHILLNTDDPGLTALCDWMDNWSQHQGIEMWAISNFAYALDCESDPSRVELLASTAREALEHLPHDHTAMFMAALLCQTELELKNTEQFVKDVQRYEYLLDSDPNENYLGAIPEKLPKAFILLGQLLTTDFQDAADLDDWIGQAYGFMSGSLPVFFRSAWDAAEADQKQQFKQ